MEVAVLDHGFVRLDAAMADDLSVVNSARVSFNKQHAEIEKGDDKLIAFLLRNRHGTPFEHNSFRFHIKAPIVVFREWQRHRISSYNEMSGRYVELEEDFYVPALEKVRTQIGKPGHYTYIPVDEALANDFTEDLRQANKLCFNLYTQYLKKGIAKEQARLFLNFNLYSQMYWTCNARSLMNFLSLRNAPDAMDEIRVYAQIVEEIFTELMPITAQAFIENGRVAP